MRERFGDDFRRFFLRGLTAVLPAILTAAILIWIFAQIQKYIGKYINAGVQWLVVQFMSIAFDRSASLKGAAEHWDTVKEAWDTNHLGWIGFVFAFVGIYIFGRFIASILGRSLWRFLERGLFRFPVIRAVYPGVKQVVEFLLSERKFEFSRVVAVEYPRKGVWSLGLVTAPGMRTISEAIGGDLLTVFIPSSPTPVTGYTITVSRNDVIDLPLNIDDALRFTVSGGVIMPINQQQSQAKTEQARQGVFPPVPPAENKENSE